MLSVAKEAKADIWGKFEGKFGRPFYSLGFCGAQERKVVVWEDVARHTHSARQTDDSEEDEKDHFETTKKKNPNAGKTSSSVGQSIDISNTIS